MVNKCKQIVAVFLSVVVLLSTLPVTVNMHFCGDFLIDATIYQSAKDCGMLMAKSTSSSETNIKVKDCCKDVQLQHAGQEVYQSTQKSIALEKSLWTATTSRLDTPNFIRPAVNQQIKADYPPPASKPPLFILHATWLI